MYFLFFIPAPTVSDVTPTNSTQLSVTFSTSAVDLSLQFKCTARPELSGLPNRAASTTSQKLVLNDLSPYVNYTVRCTSIRTRSGSGSIINSCNSSMDTIRMPESGKFTHSLYIYC